MSLQSRLTALASALGADVKALTSKVGDGGGLTLSPTIKTASQALLANTSYFVQVTATISLTMPPAPPNGTRVKITRLDQLTSVSVNVMPGNGTDKFYYTSSGSLSAQGLLGCNMTSEYMYLNGVWYNTDTGFVSLGVSAGGYPVLADPATNRASQTAAPSTAYDLVNKDYADKVGMPDKLFEEYQPAPKTTVSGWQLIATGSPTVTRGGFGNRFIGGYGTAPVDGTYEIIFTLWLSGTAAAGRLLGQVSSGNVAGSGTTYARAEYAVASGGSATYNFPTVNVVCKKWLAAGSVVNASFYVSGAYAGITSTYGTLSFELSQSYYPF